MSLGSHSECSESERSDTRRESVCNNCKEVRFRVRVCLKQYYEDERARCYVMVEKRRRVRWLERRLRQLFGLPGAFCLRSRGHLLPADEPLAILSPDDPVEVLQITNDANETNTIKTLDTSFHPPPSTSLDVIDGDIQVMSDLKLEVGPSQCEVDDIPEEIGEFHQQSMHKGNHLENYKEQALAMIEEKYSKVFEEQQNSMSSVGCNSVIEQPPRKRKRVRRRKRNSKPSPESPGDEFTPTDLPTAENGVCGVPVEATVTSDDSGAQAERAGAGAGAGAAVQRAPVRPRPPRLVHALTTHSSYSPQSA